MLRVAAGGLRHRQTGRSRGPAGRQYSHGRGNARIVPPGFAGRRQAPVRCGNAGSAFHRRSGPGVEHGRNAGSAGILQALRAFGPTGGGTIHPARPALYRLYAPGFPRTRVARRACVSGFCGKRLQSGGGVALQRRGHVAVHGPHGASVRPATRLVDGRAPRPLPLHAGGLPSIWPNCTAISETGIWPWPPTTPEKAK